MKKQVSNRRRVFIVLTVILFVIAGRYVTKVIPAATGQGLLLPWPSHQTQARSIYTFFIPATMLNHPAE